MRLPRSLPCWRAVVLAAAVIGSGMLLPEPASAQQTAQEITESRQRLQQIRAEQERLRAERTQLRTRVQDLSGELQNLEHQRGAAADLLEELDFQIETTDSAIIQTTREMEEARARMDRMQDVLNRRLREIYKRGPLHTVQVILAADSFSDLLNRYKYLHLIARQDRRLVEEIGRFQTDLSVRQRRLSRSLGQLEELRREREREHGELESIERERRRAMAALEGEERAAAERIQQLARDERQMESLLATLEERRRAEERAAAERAAATGRAPARRESTITTASLGALGWPVEGSLVYRFGRENRPGGGTVRWNGVGIAADRGTPVEAVEAGTVVLAAPFEGYGPSVILDHGGGYYSLYLYLDQVRVADGASIRRGQTVGTVGGRSGEQPHIEFQIRGPGGEALDPLRWLQQRSGR
jgi:murein hydrolase activator